MIKHKMIKWSVVEDELDKNWLYCAARYEPARKQAHLRIHKSTFDMGDRHQIMSDARRKLIDALNTEIQKERRRKGITP